MRIRTAAIPTRLVQNFDDMQNPDGLRSATIRILCVNHGLRFFIVNRKKKVNGFLYSPLCIYLDQKQTDCFRSPRDLRRPFWQI
ncbi:hypothetical protein MRB53_032811 [Persea americana]|uniref:Uncharacterized protein n=1 Tax=Persea americana TaxID=3435 RepID=A0ACC2KST7_PERAE|nr:hypothetical protein MRB53_032811 [Persea americana]